VVGPACAPTGGGGGGGEDASNGNVADNDNAAVEANGNESPPPEGLAPIRNAGLAAVNDYAYVLQSDPVLDLEPIGRSAFDLVVIDYSEDGGQEGEFSRRDIETLQNNGSRVVLAYMSIGEAEVGRFYFDNAWVQPDPDDNPDGPFELTDRAPDFLAPPNPLFPDNFKVRYWDPTWQEIVVSNPGGNPYIGEADSYLDRIVDQGFDGVYLDIIDAYEYFGPAEVNEDGVEERRDAAELMINLVAAIKQHAEEFGGREFFVFPQNGSGIIDPEAFPEDTVQNGYTQEGYADLMRDRYFEVIDGIGAEDTFYFGHADEDNPFDPQIEVIALLDRYRSAGLLVLAIDYLTDPAAIDDFYDRSRARGWVPFSSIRDLSELTINPTQPPD
jgi:cysteinyl-tRNA synthetase